MKSRNLPCLGISINKLFTFKIKYLIIRVIDFHGMDEGA